MKGAVNAFESSNRTDLNTYAAKKHLFLLYAKKKKKGLNNRNCAGLENLVSGSDLL